MGGGPKVSVKMTLSGDSGEEINMIDPYKLYAYNETRRG